MGSDIFVESGFVNAWALCATPWRIDDYNSDNLHAFVDVTLVPSVGFANIKTVEEELAKCGWMISSIMIVHDPRSSNRMLVRCFKYLEHKYNHPMFEKVAQLMKDRYLVSSIDESDAAP